jgi:two-component system sensor histidine kinase KdpD
MTPTPVLPATAPPDADVGRRAFPPAARHLAAVAACALTAAIATALGDYLDLANTVMLFLLTVVLVAVRCGRGPAVATSFLSVGLFDFFFVPPRFSFAVNDAQYLVTFGVMLAVALIIGHLTTGLQNQAEAAARRERRAQALYEMARGLSGSLQPMQVAAICASFLRSTLNADSALLLVADTGGLVTVDGDPGVPPWLDERMARMAYEGAAHTDLDAPHPVAYFPLIASRPRGILAVRSPGEGSDALRANWDLLQMVSSLVAVAVERLHYVEVANRAELHIASEHLRSSILSALSHDMRTPLTALVGLADSLTMNRSPDQQRETAAAARDQALRLSNMVDNLLEMARLHSGAVRMRRQWQLLEEVIGSSLKLLERSLADHPVHVRLPDELPLLEFDAVLMERVFCNLIENAAKYSRPLSFVEIAARVLPDVVEVTVRDNGVGLPVTQGVDIFEMFVRGGKESATPGVGLGLAICRAVIEAHGGTIGARNHPEGGACFTFTLPKGTPPSVDAEEGGELSHG